MKLYLSIVASLLLMNAWACDNNSGDPMKTTCSHFAYENVNELYKKIIDQYAEKFKNEHLLSEAIDHHKEKLFQAAIKKYSTHLKKFPTEDGVDLLLLLGIAYAQIGQINMAMAHVREAYQIDPQNEAARCLYQMDGKSSSSVPAE